MAFRLDLSIYWFLAYLLNASYHMATAATVCPPSHTAEEIADLYKSYRALSKINNQYQKDYSETSQALSCYTTEYQTALEGYRARPLNPSKVISQMLNSKFVLIGDNHLHPEDEQVMIEMMNVLDHKGAKLTIALEAVDIAKEEVFADFLSGKINIEELKQEIEYSENWAFPWGPYKKVLVEAKRIGARIIALESRSKFKSLSRRDQDITKRLLTHSLQHPNRIYMTLIGNLHLLGRRHLYDRLKKSGHGVTAIVNQDRKRYWSWLKKHRAAPTASALQLSDDVFYITYSNPIAAEISNLGQWSLFTGESAAQTVSQYFNSEKLQKLQVAPILWLGEKRCQDSNSPSPKN